MINRRQRTEYNGIWRLPTAPVDKPPLHGILRYTPGEGFELEVIGSFFNLSELLPNSQNPEIIQGTSSDGKNITLYHCFGSSISIGSSIGSQGVQTSKYKPSRVFIGALFDKEPMFKDIIINYSYLDEWVNISGFDIPMPSGTEEVSIKYKMPEDITITLDENYDLTITHSREGPNWSMVQKESCIKQKTYIMIKSKNETPITKYDDILFKIRNFLSFGVGRPVYPLTISGQSDEYISFHVGKKIYDEIEIYYNTMEIPDEFEPIIPPDMFFIFEDISKSFETFIRNWFNRGEVLAPVFDLYFSNIYTQKMYSETRFLNAAQAIESYHRRKETAKKFDIDLKEHEERMIKIICFAPIEHTAWLLAKLKHSNEVSLSQRLKEILSHHKDIAEIYVGNKGQQKDFIYKVVTTRNYLTHFDKNREAESAKGKDLSILIEKLKIIIKACLLEEMGMSSSEIKTILEKYKTRSFLSWDFISWS